MLQSAALARAPALFSKVHLGWGLELGLGPADRFPLLTSRLREPGLMQRRGIGSKPSKLH